MQCARRLLPLLVSLLAVLLWVSAPTAGADEESVRRLDVRYDVRADGTVDVTVAIDWRFAEVGRRGIVYDIVTREPWDDDEAWMPCST